MGKIEWSIKDGRLVAWFSWQKDNETSSGTGGCSANYSVPFVALEVSAKELLAKAGKVYNLNAFSGVDDWRKLV